MKVVKIIFGILMMLGALGNLRQIGDIRSSAELSGYLGVTAAIFVIGAFLLYSGLKSDKSLRITEDDDNE